MGIIRKVFDSKGFPILAAAFLILLIAERKKPLRKRKLVEAERFVTNGLVAVPSFLLARLMFIPAMIAIARVNKTSTNTIANNSSKDILGQIFAFFLLDYASYLWHKINHKVPLLWRFHVVHHTDLDLDLSTAIRFHFGEMIGSVFFRGFFVWMSGATPLTVLIYEIIFEAETQFHHSNLKLNEKFEKVLGSFIVTPRMHGIHHSNEQSITDSNYAVIFSFWDRFFGTLNLRPTQDELQIGAPNFHNKVDFSAIDLLRLPFEKRK